MSNVGSSREQKPARRTTPGRLLTLRKQREIYKEQSRRVHRAIEHGRRAMEEMEK